MRILAVGGGSGGHVTPVVAVLRELRTRKPNVEIRFWCDRGFATQARGIVSHFDPTLPVSTIIAGKLRRYHTIPLHVQLLRPWLVLQNIGNLFMVGVGVLQSLVRLVAWRPDVVFTKGGFVCLPVGFAAHILNIPLVIHDSDAHPGLTNRILARWATSIATGAPLQYYSYPVSRAQYVGIPVESGLEPHSDEKKASLKQSLGLRADQPLVVVTGGGLGATRINDTLVAIHDQLLRYSSVVLVSGTHQYDELVPKLPPNSTEFQLHAFVADGMTTLLGAADVVVTRAGATTMLELAALGQATIIIPNAYLTGGHQLKNAAVYSDARAAIVIDETSIMHEPRVLLDAITGLLADATERKRLQAIIHTLAKPDAARDVATMIITAAA